MVIIVVVIVLDWLVLYIGVGNWVELSIVNVWNWSWIGLSIIDVWNWSWMELSIMNVWKWSWIELSIIIGVRNCLLDYCAPLTAT